MFTNNISFSIRGICLNYGLDMRCSYLSYITHSERNFRYSWHIITQNPGYKRWRSEIVSMETGTLNECRIYGCHLDLVWILFVNFPRSLFSYCFTFLVRLAFVQIRPVLFRKLIFITSTWGIMNIKYLKK